MTRPFILVVEDNPYDEALTCRVLRRISRVGEIVVMHDGAEALDFLFAQGVHSGRRSDDLPQVMLLDLNLPKVNGHEVLRQIRARGLTQCLPVVILTSSDEHADVAMGYREGANSYVIKPVAFDRYVETVRQLGLYWVDVNLQNGAAQPDHSPGQEAGAPIVV